MKVYVGQGLCLVHAAVRVIASSESFFFFCFSNSLYKVVIGQEQDCDPVVHDVPGILKALLDILPKYSVVPCPRIIASRDRDDFGRRLDSKLLQRCLVHASFWRVLSRLACPREARQS